MIRIRSANILTILGLVALAGVILSGIGIRDSVAAVRAMETFGVAAWAAQGDVQYSMHESRRRFVYALTTSDPNRQLPYVSQARAADAEVQLRLKALVELGLPPEAVRGAQEFQRLWTRHLQARDEVLSLILEGRAGEAVRLESGRGTESFERASAALQAMRHRLAEHARSQAALVQTTFRHVVIELALLFATLGWLGWTLLNRFRSDRNYEREKGERLARSAQLEANRSRVLELTGKNEPLQSVLEALCTMLEQQMPGTVAAVSIFHEGQLREMAGPRLPAAFRESQFAQAGPGDLCANRTAAQSGQPVYSAAVAVAAAGQHGFLAAWSYPVVSNAGPVVGTADVFLRTARQPESGEVEALRGAAQLAAIAIDHRQLYEELFFQAQRDALTELPNRRLLQERLETAIASAARLGQKVAVLMVDLSRFKQVNDLFGHRAGDTLLRTVAQRLIQCVRPGDTVARVGGDEFTIVLNSVPSAEAAEHAAQSILAALALPMSLGERETSVSARIGISLYPSDSEDPGTLIRNADLALYQVKSGGGSGYQRYGPQVGAVWLKRMSMEKGLAQALQNREFHLLYQPQVDLNRSLVGTEALIRWVSPELGLVPPAEFIPVAEETGQIMPIGRWVLQEACRQSAAWRRAGHQPLRMAVNISARQLSEAGFVEYVRDTLAQSGLRPEMLELELTETALMEKTDGSLVRLHQLRDLGIHIAIDDFGTGYSSLSYLQKLPVASLKIDRSFVLEITSDSTSTVPVIQAIVDLAHGIGLNVVAEGVETERQFQTLRALGCDSIQGYLISPPIPAGDIEPLFERSWAANLLQLHQQTGEAVPAEGSPHVAAALMAGEPGRRV